MSYTVNATPEPITSNRKVSFGIAVSEEQKVSLQKITSIVNDPTCIEVIKSTLLQTTVQHMIFFVIERLFCKHCQLLRAHRALITY
jgi:hypothetical protein